MLWSGRVPLPLERSGWVREDGLGTISTIQFLDLPADQSAMVEDFLEKTKAELNPIKLAFLRWQLQAQLLKVGHVTLGEGHVTVYQAHVIPMSLLAAGVH